MPILTRLPPSASLTQKITYAPVRSFFFFFFSYLPYYPIKRVNKPELKGPYMWASSHSNFLCDAVPAGFEGERPTKFLAKSTLFKFPLKPIIEFCGSLPVARAEDLRDLPKEERSKQNKQTFKAAIAAMEKGWPVAIFPEGVSLVLPGLYLPLKPGIAKIAFTAEEENGFNLGLRIIPVGLEYGSRNKVASGLTIRYGKPLVVKDYQSLYEQNDSAAIKQLMSDLTREMVSVFPHFQDEHKQNLGRKLVALGLSPSKHAIAQLFLKKENDVTFWKGLDEKLLAFEEANKEKGIPVPAWGLRRYWKEVGPVGRIKRLVFIFLGLPLGILDLINNSVPEFCLSSLVEYVSVDETEKMSIRFIASPVVLGLAYGVQFYFLKKVVFEFTLADVGWGSYLAYSFGSFFLWYFAVHWRRQLKRFASLYFFRRAGIDGRSQAVGRYRNLRQHLSELQDHR